MPDVDYASGITVPTEDSPITANKGDIEDPDNSPTNSLGTIGWKWSTATANGGTYTDIPDATSAAFTPGDAQVGMYLQVCASFTDAASNPEERCLQISAAVANINARPEAENNTIEVFVTATADNPYVFKQADFRFEDADHDTLVRVDLESVPSVGTLRTGSDASGVGNQFYANPTGSQLGFSSLTYYPASGQSPTNNYASFTFSVRDSGGMTSNNAATITINLIVDPNPTNATATGAPAVTAADSADLTMVGPNEDSVLTAAMGTIADTDGITTFTPAWAWQQADAPASGAPMDSAYTAITGATAATFTPLQVHVGKFIRVCATFDDDAGNSESRCRASVAAVVNVHDRPVAEDNTIFVPVGNSHAFSADDFPFADEDGYVGARVHAVTVPANGDLHLDGTLVTGRAGVSISSIHLLVYTPPTDATTPMAGYADFDFSVNTGSTNADSSNNATLTIDLISDTATAATGAPTVTAAIGTAYKRGVELTASTTGITEPNGIDTAHPDVAMAVRHRARYQHPGGWRLLCRHKRGDRGKHSHPCRRMWANTSASASVSWISWAPCRRLWRSCAPPPQQVHQCPNDDPASADASVSVPITATADTPYTFKDSDFPYMDEDGDSSGQHNHSHARIASGRGTFRNGSCRSDRQHHSDRRQPGQPELSIPRPAPPPPPTLPLSHSA